MHINLNKNPIMALQTLFPPLISLFSLLSVLALAPEKTQMNTYIVHVQSPDSDIDTTDYHNSFLPQNSLVYSYKHVISGFSARLTAEQVETLKKKKGFISARRQRLYRPLTTRSPAFLGLTPHDGIWKQTDFGRGIIIGLVDTGIYPTHPSFDSSEMAPPPAKWNGTCELPKGGCNNKIIGARSFSAGDDVSLYNDTDPTDYEGHGTHTASIAAGGFVRNANVFGNAYGTAAGMAPFSHLAIYKACFEDGCWTGNILAAMDAAVDDGVDILSLSTGGVHEPFYHDDQAVGAFHAIKKGIFVSTVAGNSGPSKGTLINEAPWMLTVGASTIDRRFPAVAKLGDGRMFDGESIYQPKNFSRQLLRLVYHVGPYGTQECYNGSLTGFDVRGKMVLCDQSELINPVNQGKEVRNAGAAAMILINGEALGFSHMSFDLVLPATYVSHAAGQEIKAYVKSKSSPTATILFKGTVIGDPFAPVVSYFSSRGPSTQAVGILKPDIIAPGENILAAWTPLGPADNLGLKFKIESGTSMSCPHLSGIAALIKSAHPNWSPAAIKSAIMTTAYLVNAHGIPILDEKLAQADIFAMGAGHVNPSRATDPGLVYDMNAEDYVPYLCGLGYTNEQIHIITQEPTNCTSKIPAGQLNYPTFSVSLGPPTTFSRTVTNVGEAVSCYSVKIIEPQGVKVVVKPCKLCFTRLNQRAEYYVTFSRSKNMTFRRNPAMFSQGFLLWESAVHTVRSVMAVNFTGHV